MGNHISKSSMGRGMFKSHRYLPPYMTISPSRGHSILSNRESRFPSEKFNYLIRVHLLYKHLVYRNNLTVIICKHLFKFTRNLHISLGIVLIKNATINIANKTTGIASQTIGLAKNSSTTPTDL